jgi:hypothetical protein
LHLEHNRIHRLSLFRIPAAIPNRNRPRNIRCVPAPVLAPCIKQQNLRQELALSEIIE